MSNEQVWIGLDLGQRRTHVCVIDHQGTPLHEQFCETSVEAVEAMLEPYPRASIGLIAVEAGTGTHLARKLREQGFPVGIFESRKASKFLAIRTSKTDHGDAKGLADIARLGRNTVSQVFLKSVECQQLRSKLVLRQRIVRLRMGAESILRSRLSLFGRDLVLPRSRGTVSAYCEPLLKGLQDEDGIDLHSELEPVIDLVDSLRSFLKRLDRELETEAGSNPVCQRLMEVPGVGSICAISFYTAIEDPTRFRRPSDVAAFLGLNPKRYQSGEASRVRGITKNGSKLTRSHLVLAATVFRTRNPECALSVWANALRERIGSKRSRVALARKLAIVLLTMWRNGTHFEEYPERGDRPALPAG